MLSIVFAALFAAAALANPVDLEARPTPECSTVWSGYLAGNVSGTLKTFTLSSKNQVSYIGDGKNPLAVEFQHCTRAAKEATVQSPPYDHKILGQIYVPSKKQCIAITHQENKVGPYYTGLRPCDGQYHERWIALTDDKNAIYWFGDTDLTGTTRQGGCGFLGYKSYNHGVPVNTHSNHQITVECKGTAFKLAKKAA